MSLKRPFLKIFRVIHSFIQFLNEDLFEVIMEDLFYQSALCWKFLGTILFPENPWIDIEHGVELSTPWHWMHRIKTKFGAPISGDCRWVILSLMRPALTASAATASSCPNSTYHTIRRAMPSNAKVATTAAAHAMQHLLICWEWCREDHTLLSSRSLTLLLYITVLIR